MLPSQYFVALLQHFTLILPVGPPPTACKPAVDQIFDMRERLSNRSRRLLPPGQAFHGQQNQHLAFHLYLLLF